MEKNKYTSKSKSSNGLWTSAAIYTLMFLLILAVVEYVVWTDTDEETPEDITRNYAINYWDNDIKTDYLLTANGKYESDYIFDEAELLTVEDYVFLDNEAKKIADNYGINIVVVTVDALTEPVIQENDDFAIDKDSPLIHKYLGYYFDPKTMWMDDNQSIAILVAKKDKQTCIKVSSGASAIYPYSTMLYTLRGMRSDMDKDNASYAVKGAFMNLASEVYEYNIEETPEDYAPILKDVREKAASTEDDFVRINGKTKDEALMDELEMGFFMSIVLTIITILMMHFRMFVFGVVGFMYSGINGLFNMVGSLLKGNSGK